MPRFLKLWVISLIAYIALDLLWVTILAKDFYFFHLGDHIGPIRWGAVFLFYLLYTFGLLVFVLLPASKETNWKIAVFKGALFGLVCYATYDLINLATLINWPLRLTLFDLVWGTFCTAVTSIVTYWVTTFWWRSIDPD